MLMHWILLALLSALFYGSYHFFIKVASEHIHQIVGAIILQSVALLCGLLCLLFLKFNGVALDVTVKGVRLAIFAGLGAGISEIIAFYMFAKGVPASVGIPVIIAGTVIVGVLLGIIFLKETLQPIHYLAVTMVVVGVIVLAQKTA